MVSDPSSLRTLSRPVADSHWSVTMAEEVAEGDSLFSYSFLFLVSLGFKDNTSELLHSASTQFLVVLSCRKGTAPVHALHNSRAMCLSFLFPCDSSDAAHGLFCNYCFQLGQKNIHKQCIFKNIYFIEKKDSYLIVSSHKPNDLCLQAGAFLLSSQT